MGKQVILKPRNANTLWGKLNLAWVIFFLAMGVLNLYVAFQFSEDTWVNFKLFGSTGLLVIFIILQSIWLGKHIES